MNGPDTKIFSKGDKIAFAIIGVLTLLAIITWKSVHYFNGKFDDTKITKEKKKSSKKDSAFRKAKGDTVVSDVSIIKKWDMPDLLKEVSGIAYMGDQRFACVQDERGSIFIFNTVTNKIEREISFGQSGDYEGIALQGNTAYVVRADGRIFEVDMNAQEKPRVKEHRTSLTVKQNVECIAYDISKKRLLLAIKDDEPGGQRYKGIYAYDLAKSAFNDEPVFRINLDDTLIAATKKKTVMPSSLAIHPGTGEMYITDGPQSQLLILDKEGKVSRLLQLGKNFPQPEGLTFGSKEEIYISNEGSKEPGNIIQVEIK